MNLPSIEEARKIVAEPIPQDVSVLKCLGCLDRGWYFKPPQVVGEYPEGTDATRMTIVKPTVEACTCQDIIRE